jgi:hypothetical protein
MCSKDRAKGTSKKHLFNGSFVSDQSPVHYRGNESANHPKGLELQISCANALIAAGTGIDTKDDA